MSDLVLLDGMAVPTKHEYYGKAYVRTNSLPANTVGVGIKHKYSSIFRLVKGTAYLVNPDTLERKLIKQGFINISKAGAQRIVVTITDCVFQSFHPTLGHNLGE